MKKRGKTFPLWAFSSCTGDAEVAEEFYFGGESNILYAIDGGSTARNVERYTARPEEKEVLLPCATAFRIKSVIGMDSGMLVVHMEQRMEQREQQGGYVVTMLASSTRSGETKASM